MKPNFEIYSASAGSGKTFTLAKTYLQKVLADRNEESFKRILALTFTNKACEEMKSRILISLSEFAKNTSTKKPSDILKSVERESTLDYRSIQLKSKKILQKILHNFSFFQVSTIDSFNHNLIRSFSNELNIVSDFLVVLDSEEIIDESIDKILSDLDKESLVFRLLVDFSNEKIRDGKSWDVSYDLKELSKLLFNENIQEHIKKLGLLKIDQFYELKRNIQSSIIKIKKEILSNVKKCRYCIEKTGLKPDFTRNTFPNFLDQIQKNKHLNKSNENLEKLFLTNRVFKKNEYNKHEIKSLEKELFKYFKFIDKKISDLKLNKSLLRSVVPASVLNKVKKATKNIQDERKEILIGEFNLIISNEIKDQPAPYIYEKVGNKIEHFLIDEFQDTSKLQWSNLIPLISHTLESCESSKLPGSLTILGDVKQSLYRWRGADPSSFALLLDKHNPFTTEKKIKHLPHNYRSKKEIVEFNNSFFSHISQIFNYLENRIAYSEAHQQAIKKTEGYVSIEFTNESSDKDKKQNDFLKKTHLIINESLKRGFNYSDQCVLVRNRKEQNLITEFLIEKNIPAISSDSLLISNSDKVQLLLNLIRLRTSHNNLKARKYILSYILKNSDVSEEFLFIEKGFKMDIEIFFRTLFRVSYSDYIGLSVLDFLNKLLVKIDLDFRHDIYTQFFYNELFTFFKNKKGNANDFLCFFEKNKDKLYITLNDTNNAVSVLTIHKSKGLEFPLIIYPFADSKAHIRSNKKIVYPFAHKGKQSELLIGFNKEVSRFGEFGRKVSDKTLMDEELDNVNILYVAFTRAINELYVICTRPKISSVRSHNEMIRSFLENSDIYDEDKDLYKWGVKTKFKSQTEQRLEDDFNPKSLKKIINPVNYIYENDKDIEMGNLFHQFMSKVDYSYRMKRVKYDFSLDENINKNQVNKIFNMAKKVIDNSDLTKFFTKDYEIICEKEIFNENQEILIPDRIMLDKNQKATIIDYKTGEPRKSDLMQIREYKIALKKMNINVEKALLVYVGSSIEVINA